VLTAAEKGIYPAERLEVLSPAQLRSFWLRGEGDWAGSYRAKKELRAAVEFRRLNLLHPFSHLGRFALIFCRNVMIYFDKKTQGRVVERLAGCLEPGGYLVIGHAESLTGIEYGLRYVHPAVYRKPCSFPVKGKR
jgi:chemotaxis protein methyltransferase CheR